MSAPRWQSPLSGRYASTAMLALWSDQHRIGVWRRLWLALAETERELGISIPQEAIEEMRRHLDDADLQRAAELEARFRHDVMAHVHAFGEQAPLARPFIHLGATSATITDNADLLIMREGLSLLLGRLVQAVERLREFAQTQADRPCLAYTHFQPAQLTTVGKRATLWLQDFALDIEEVIRRIEGLRFRGGQGTTGTQASFLQLFDGDHERVLELERGFARRMGFAALYPVTSQTYPRKADSQIIDALGGVAQSAAKFALDLRLLQHEGELLEPFEAEQIGSSAMAYKRNPMRAERIGALARHVISLQANAAHTAANQWLERTLDDSANRRITLPEAFLATDAILLLVANIAGGIVVEPEVIARNVARQMPFMATERWLMLATRAGGDRQQLHETIRRQSLEVAELVSRGAPNDLLERLARSADFATIPVEQLRAELDPAHYTGRASRQVGEFLTDFLSPLLTRARQLAAVADKPELQV